MAKSMLSLLGMYQYDDTILDNLVLPAELEGKRSIIKDNLLLESAELEVLFTDFSMLKYAIGVWSQKELPVWRELYNTTQYEYNPIWNKDGTFRELETRDFAGTSNNTETRNRAGRSSNTETRNLAGTSSNTETRNLAGSETETGSGSDDTNNYVYGYNSETRARESDSETDTSYSRSNQSTQTGTVSDQGSSSDTGTITEQGNTSDTGTVAEEGNTSETGTIARERTEQGNIGLTSTQSLILEQRNVVEFNIMNRIIKDFIARFCILVY